MSYLNIRLLPIILIMSLFHSCSWLSKRKSLFGGPKEEMKPKMKEAPKAVSNDQYNQLLERYDRLKREHEQSIMKTNSSKLMSDLGKAPEVEPELPLDNAPSLADTVDVFADDGPGMKKPNVVELGKFSARDRFPVSINTEINQLKEAQNARRVGDINGAMKIYRIIEKSSNEQVKVRAKYNIAEILFDQKDYDLAMQAYEEIINSHAYSGLVIKALGRLIACTEKLKLKEKKEKYYSILHDFFKQGK